MTWHSPIGCGVSFESSWWARFHSSVKTFAYWVCFHHRLESCQTSRSLQDTTQLCTLWLVILYLVSWARCWSRCIFLMAEAEVVKSLGSFWVGNHGSCLAALSLVNPACFRYSLRKIRSSGCSSGRARELKRWNKETQTTLFLHWSFELVLQIWKQIPCSDIFSST